MVWCVASLVDDKKSHVLLGLTAVGSGWLVSAASETRFTVPLPTDIYTCRCSSIRRCYYTIPFIFDTITATITIIIVIVILFILWLFLFLCRIVSFLYLVVVVCAAQQTVQRGHDPRREAETVSTIPFPLETGWNPWRWFPSGHMNSAIIDR